MKIRYKKINDNAEVPAYQTAGAAGADVHACLDEPIILKPGEIALVPTGFALEIPEGYEVQLRPRSGLALKYGISLPNAPATIDSDYRGEIKVILINHGKEPFKVEHGDRIAQMVVARHETVQFELTDELSDSIRGEKRFGSTGISKQ